MGAVTYQWQRGGSDIAGAAGATYTLTQADVGEAITVVACYTDGEGTPESVTRRRPMRWPTSTTRRPAR